jgi:hypothetical protein
VRNGVRQQQRAAVLRHLAPHKAAPREVEVS